MLENITLPESLTRIGDSVFRKCTSLTSISIPNGVKAIDRWTFANCSALANVAIGVGVEKIDDRAFENCTALTSITIPETVTEIHAQAFDGCTALTTIYGYNGSAAQSFANEHGYTFIALQKLVDDVTGVSVSEGSFGNFPQNTALTVETLMEDETAVLYGIVFTANDELFVPTHNVTVQIPVPSTMDRTQCGVYQWNNTDETFTAVQASYQDGYMVFTAAPFDVGAYALATFDLSAPYMLGDVNADGAINAVDARWVLQAASGARELDEYQAAAADVNCDGNINAVDARWILQAASGAREL